MLIICDQLCLVQVAEEVNVRGGHAFKFVLEMACADYGQREFQVVKSFN